MSVFRDVCQESPGKGDVPGLLYTVQYSWNHGNGGQLTSRRGNDDIRDDVVYGGE